MLMACALFLWCFFVLGLCGVVFFLAEIFQWNSKEWIVVFVFSHPYIVIAAAAAVYLFLVFWLTINVAKITLAAE